MAEEPDAPLTVLSLFTGAGGLDLGFEQAKFDVVACLDNDPESCKTLRYNRPTWKVYEKDIRAYEPIERADVVIGGPPCQGFSTAGKGDPNDPRNFLWMEYLRVVEAAKPPAIVLEHVAGLLLRKNRHHVEALIESLEGIGYKVAVGVLNAADFQVPQSRRRLIVIGLLNGEPTLPVAIGQRHVTVREAIADLAGKVEPDFNHVPNRHAESVVKRWKHLEYGESDPLYHRARLDPDKPSHTIRAGGGYGPKGNHLAGFHPPIHFSEPRQLTVREAARLQSFPDDWIFQGSKTAQGRQVGNAVPPRLAFALATHVRKLLLPDPTTSKSESDRELAGVM